VVVLDILFATTTMVTALAHGAIEAIPVADEAAARAAAAERRAGDVVLSGELYAEPCPDSHTRRRWRCCATACAARP